MRGPRLFIFLSLEIGEDQKKGLYVRKCVFTGNIGEDQKKKIRGPHFLRGSRFQPAYLYETAALRMII